MLSLSETPPPPPDPRDPRVEDPYAILELQDALRLVIQRYGASRVERWVRHLAALDGQAL